MRNLYSLKFETPERDKEIEEKYGGYNDFPPDWKEIAEEEFAKSMFFTYSPDLIQHRQMMKPNEVVEATLHFFWDGNGYAIGHDFWKGKVKYYRFALCEHTYRELSPSEARAKGHSHFGNCYHVTECAKCGLIWEYDSSG